MKPNIEDILACPLCLCRLSHKGEVMKCPQCQRSVPIKGKTVFFSDVQTDITPDGIGYARDKTIWSAYRKMNYAFLRDKINGISPGNTVLDVGAGPGFFDDLFAPFPRYYSLDFYPYPNIDIVSNIVKQSLPIRSSCADCVLLSNVLEHVPDPNRVLNEIYRVLKADGQLILIVPFIFKLHQEPYDYCRYTHHMLGRLLQEAGYRAIAIRKLGTIKDVLEGVQYEFKQVLRSTGKHPLILKVLMSMQYHLQKLASSLFFPADQPEAAARTLFPGYACTARK